MTERRIKELAAEVAKEVNTTLGGFAIESAFRDEHAVVLNLCWKLPFRIEVSIQFHDSDTDETIKEEIRRQLRKAAPALDANLN
jgi:hypothetical protein